MDLPNPVISSPADIAHACATLAKSPFVAVDTEFMRQTTYRPKLCLIQLACPGFEAVIDPIETGADLAPFFQLMANPAVVKVFHAARQDIEIVVQEAGVIPKPLFDTQVAAMALGYGDSIAYGALIKRVLKRNHDKTFQAMDWCARPLSPKQIEYALGDVTHLRDLYPVLKKRLVEQGREHWLDEEIALLIDPKTYAFDPADAWKRLKLGGKSRTQRAVIMELAAWRERTAQEENVPRSRVLKDDAIYEIAKHIPKSAEALGRLRAVREGLKGNADAIMGAIHAGIARKASDVPDPSENADLSVSALASVELLRVLLKAVASKLDIAPKLLAGTDDLEKIVLSDDPDTPAVRGWRREVFGDHALALKRGTLALTLQGKEITLVNI
jgi:ribonuclease D